MRKSFSISAVLACILILATVTGVAMQRQATVIDEAFEGVSSIRIKTVSGDCVVARGEPGGVNVQVKHTYPNDRFEAIFEQRGDELVLEEDFSSSGWGGVSGNSVWQIWVPDGIRVEFSTASGDLEASDMDLDLDVRSASGDIKLREVSGTARVRTASGDVEADTTTTALDVSTASGDIHLTSAGGDVHASTASGDIEGGALNGVIELSAASGNIIVTDSTGEFKVSAASGNLNIQQVRLESESSFSAASGHVEVGLAESPAFDLSISSASGDSRLNFNGHPIRGAIEMSARARKGRIHAPFQFESEERYREWTQEYVTKTASFGEGGPLIRVKTASGKAIIRER